MAYDGMGLWAGYRGSPDALDAASSGSGRCRMTTHTTAQRCHLALQAFLDRRVEAKVRCLTPVAVPIELDYAIETLAMAIRNEREIEPHCEALRRLYAQRPGVGEASRANSQE